MRKSKVAMIIVLGAVVLLCYSASAKKCGKYVGSEQCITCHKSTHEALTNAYSKTMHHKAMTDVTNNPDAIVAVFDDQSPFKKDQVKYVLGTGKVYQNYLDAELKLLPGKWDAREKKWVAAEPVDAVTQCIGCHTTNFDPDGKSWTELGVGCESCHGPGEAHAASMDAKDIKNPKKLDSKKRDMVCGQCHSTGKDPSGKLAYSVAYCPGDDLGDHFKLTSPGEGAANSQYNDHLASKHAANGVKCTSCHDSHGDKAKAAHQLKKPINDLCQGCHQTEIGDVKAIESLSAHAPSAKPEDTCASCHMLKGSHKFGKAK